jgi:hypothetical protein
MWNQPIGKLIFPSQDDLKVVFIDEINHANDYNHY